MERGVIYMKLKKRIMLGCIFLCSLLLTTACLPPIPTLRNGTVVGSAQFSTIISNFSDLGEIAYVNVNGGAVTTPNGVRVRLNKASFSIPARGIFLTATRFKDVSTENIPRSEIMASRVKGKNTCAYVEGIFNEDGQTFQIWILGDSGQQYMYMTASAGGFYWGEITSGKLHIGGRNLCG